MPQYFPHALKFFKDFEAARREEYKIAWEDLNPRAGHGYGYKQVDEDDREELFASIKDLRYNLGGNMRDLLVPEEHPTPQRAVASIVDYRDMVLRDLKSIEEMAKRYPQGKEQPPPISYILGYERDVVEMLDHILGMDEVKPFLPPSFHERASTNQTNSHLASMSFDFWSLMHPRVIEVSKKLYDDGHRKQAVQEAYIALETRVREYYVQVRGEKKYGTALMSAAFTKNNPVIRLFPASDPDHEEKQEGYMHIYMGVMLAIRNPKSHSNFTVEEVDAIEMLFFASRLFKKIESAVKP